ncbi:MAG: polysaccharide deacetylase family protein [Solirubrobacterales bacterium]|nr:polysaccharide deacetylase family protein [Solirubrobacterales bacterium]
MRGAAWRGRHGPTVLLYHRIADLDSDPLGLAVSPAHFAEHLDVLRDRGVIGLAEAAAGAPGIAVTFDDGYADNLVLRDAGIPVTLFVTTGAVEGGHGFWWDAIDRVCRERAGERIHVEDRAFVLGPVARAHLHQWLQPRDPRDIDAVLQALGALDGDRPLTLDELRELAGHVEIGAHTRTHRSLRHATTAEQRAEIERSRDDLAQWLGRAPAAFSYPFGVPGDAFDATAKRLVREAGFTCAVANAPESSADRFAIPRHTAPDVDGEGFARWLDALG